MAEPWVFESGKIDFSSDVENILLRNESINKYLSTSNRDHYLFLVGPKGIGKTFLLNYKSYLLRQEHSKEGIKFSPALELSENLLIFFTQFSKEEILKYQTADVWENIWKYCLLAVSCNAYGIAINEKLGQKDVDFSKVSNVLTFLLSDRKNINKILQNGMIVLMKQVALIQSGVSLFLDGIDQAVDSLVDENFYDYSTYENNALKVWTSIHIGIAKSIYDLIKINSHIRIYTTLRSEAFKLIPGGMALNLEGFAIHLSYSPLELKEIFYKNIKLIEQDKLIKEFAASPVEQFLGYDEMRHPFVPGINEKAIDFLLRHTLGRPREAVFFGHKIFYEKTTKEDYRALDVDAKIEEIRFFINEKSEEVLNNYLKEIIPSFDEEQLVKFLKKIQSNIFHHNILNEEEKRFLGICYNIGLIGIVNHKTDKDLKTIKVQSFKKAGEYVYNNINRYPISDYYITHPILDCYFAKLFNLEFYNSKNIIGNNYNFHMPEYLYDYAISYSNEDKVFVEDFASEMKSMINGVKLFYDKDLEKEIIGGDLINYLHEIYKKSAKNVIIFMSHNYLKSKWASYEFNIVKQRLLNDYNSKFIKIVIIDDVKIPEIIESRAYIDGNNKTPKQIAQILC